MAKEPENSDRPEHKRGQLQAVFDRNYHKVVAFFTRGGVPAESARDLAQDTFLRAHRGWEQFRGDAKEETWLFEIARNLLKNWYRDRSALKKQGIEVPLDATSQDEENPRPKPELIDQGLQALDQVIASERKERLLDAVAQLPGQRRQALKLRHQGLQYSEIAAVMGLSIETVKSHLYQARETLKKTLADLQ